ncbi:hypothetical protein ACG7TL_008272 [Trametes sanguinea]
MAVPPAPPLPGDALLEIFIHPASVPPNRVCDPTNKFSDGRRLEALGKSLVELAYRDVMQTKWPRSSATEISALVNSTISGFMERAVHAYQWKNAVRGRPPSLDAESREEAGRIFCTYAGAVHVEYGYERLRGWIDALTTI